MKISQLLAAAVMAIGSAQACIRVHSVMTYNPLFGDGLRVQIWDNDDFYEVQDQGKRGANGDTHWNFDFGAGHHVEMWNNGKSGRIYLDNGWKADLQRGKDDFQKDCVVDSDNGCRLYETQYTACLNDGFGNCGGYSCDLCDFNDCRR